MQKIKLISTPQNAGGVENPFDSKGLATSHKMGGAE